MPATAGVVQWGQRRQLFELGDHRVVEDGGPIEILTAVHHPVPDCREPVEVTQLFEGMSQRGIVVGKLRPTLADLLDEAVRARLA